MRDGGLALRGAVTAFIDGSSPSGDAPVETDARVRQMRLLAGIAVSPDSTPSTFDRLCTRVSVYLRASMRLGRARGGVRASRVTDALAVLASDTHRARSPREIAAALHRHLPSIVSAPVVAVLTLDGRAWRTLAGDGPALDPQSATSALLCGGTTVRVDTSSLAYALLPVSDREWLARFGVAALVPIASPHGRPLAGVLVGRRHDGRPHTRADRACLGVAANMAAVALATCGRTCDARGEGAADVAFECGDCGAIREHAGTCTCARGTGLVAAALPVRLHGFDVIRRIGRGGMGVAYLARDRRLDRLVVLKTPPGLAPAALDGIRAEARAMAAIDHPQVAVLYGLEEWRETPVLVVEYLPGGTLSERLAHGPLAVPDAIALGASIADVLAALHARGWLHRDVKPANIAFDSHGLPKLLDFGLTRWTADRTETSVAGTPRYLSPDAIDGAPPGEHDDVWALAVTTVEMMTGVHPFATRTPAGVLRQIRCRDRVDVRALAPGIPPDVADVLSRALHPRRSARLTSAAAFAAALRR
ncbi:MAG: serine/threonine protein kinase [Acidobacteria bacterium]|nr:serine/threonine protein kinase [Acidobacteriota bacterium]